MTVTINGSGSITEEITIDGVKVGQGGGNVTTNTAVGASALAANTSGGGNTAVGLNALAANTTANQNSAFGTNALQANTTGLQNAAFGRSTLAANTTGTANTAVGTDALISNTTASNNTAVGYQAGYSNTTGYSNAIFGQSAGYTNTTGIYNTYIGPGTGYSATGSGNVFIGNLGSSGAVGCGYSMTTGNNNVIIGGHTGNNDGLDIRTSGNYILLSEGAGSWGARWYPGIGWYQKNNSASWSTTSDQRIKKNITGLENGLSIVCQLRPVEFDYILSGNHDIGFIAQEYEQVLPDQITHDSDGDETIKALTNGEPVKGIQQNLVPYLVKAIQELSAQVTALQAEVNALKGQ